MMEAGELLGMSERQFRRYRERYEEARPEWLDRRLGKWSARRVPEAGRQRTLELYRAFLDEDAAACCRAGRAGQAARGAPAQTAAQVV